MNIPQGAIDFLVYLAPSLLVFGTAWFLVKKFLDSEQRLKQAELKRTIDNNLLPLRLQAYERIVLFLERISPNNLLVRVFEPGMNVSEFHKALLQTIRTEFEHNITQQVYVTNGLWASVRDNRDELIKILNISLGECRGDGPGLDLTKRVFDKLAAMGESPIQKAIDQVKNEAHALF